MKKKDIERFSNKANKSTKFQIQKYKIFIQHAQLTLICLSNCHQGDYYISLSFSCSFNHVVLSRSPTSGIIVLIFQHNIIVIHYRPRYTAVKPRDTSQPEGKRVSECLRVTRRRPHNTYPCPLKFNCEFDSIFTRQVSASSVGAPGRLWKSDVRIGKLFTKCHAIESRPSVILSFFLPVMSLIYTCNSEINYMCI